MPHAESAWDLFSIFLVPFEVGKFDLLDGMFFFFLFQLFQSFFNPLVLVSSDFHQIFLSI